LRRPTRPPARRVAGFASLVLAAALAGRAPTAAGQETCGECHEGEPAAVAASVHGILACADCHAGAEEFPHAETVARPACGDCPAAVGA
jgi:hypothetical protein